MLRKLAPITSLAFVAALAACGGGQEAPSQPATPAPSAEAPAAAPAAGGYQVVAVTNGGTIHGMVKATGNVPAPTKVEINKDTSVCGTEKVLKDIEMGSNGELQDAVVWIDNISSGKDWDDASEGTVDQVDCHYVPQVQVLKPGGSLEVVNSDPILHNIHAYDGDQTLFNIAQPIKGQKSKKEVDASGPVHLRCDVHSWMSAWVFMAKTPYFAITGADGSYSIGDVPPGDYTVKVWHGKLGETSTDVKVEPGAQATADLTINVM